MRATAFFKSVSGQLEVVDGGAPFVYFDLGAGRCATCNPISEPDLAAALVDTISDPSKNNALWNLGGPDAGLSMTAQGELLADVLGKEKANLLGVPIGIFDVIISGLQWGADTFKSEKLADAAEFGRIGRYYAVEDMLTTDPSEKYGRTTLREHYERISKEGQVRATASTPLLVPLRARCAPPARPPPPLLHRQDYDPYTTLFGSKEAKETFAASKDA